MTRSEQLTGILQKHQHEFHPVVEFNPTKEKLLSLDFTENNKELTEEILSDTSKFCDYIREKLKTRNAKLGIGGYAEHRSVYSRSSHFDTKQGEPRRLHLGIDIWGEAGTKIYAPLGGMVHSFAFNDHHGDYGATIILLHQLDGFPFYTLYGHLSLADISHLRNGSYVNRGQLLAHFGEPHENGQWPPHLHFQLIIELEAKQGDYPGVCKFSEREKYLSNCPNPDLILQMNRFL
jgi:murein DD-endopeptidase MepM/ murein hydrolase activator NlpD